MMNQTAVEEEQFRRLRAAYDAAFQEWVAQVHLLESLTSLSTHKTIAIEEAQARVEQAQNAYRESRNLLAEFLMSRPAKTESRRSPSASTGIVATQDAPPPKGGSESGTDPKFQVEHLAYLLWEKAGRPSGSAETDWYRAEQLIGRRL